MFCICVDNSDYVENVQNLNANALGNLNETACVQNMNEMTCIQIVNENVCIQNENANVLMNDTENK